MRLCVDGSGRVDPGRMLSIRSLGFREVYEAHVAQDAMDTIQRQNQERIRREMANRRR